MTSIPSSGFPLVFKVEDERTVSEPKPIGDQLDMRLDVRALEGMQKEALVSIAGGATWRMVSDEGPYLNGTDLAPFPLAFFTAGQQFSLLSEIVQLARAQHIKLNSLEVVQDNYYAMNGSFIRGDAVGSAMSPDVLIHVETESPREMVARLVHMAADRSAGYSVMRNSMRNLFSLTLNGRALHLDDLPSVEAKGVVDPGDRFSRVQPDRSTDVPVDIIAKTGSAERLEGVEGGVGSSLKSEQKRTLHIHGEARLIDGLLMETLIQLIKPIGSSFRFLCDETAQRGGDEVAPPPLAYLSAALGFCYLTQLGRYAHITKQDLKSYRIVQHVRFGVPSNDTNEQASVSPVETHVLVDAEMSDSDARQLVCVGERTCFLHAALRDVHLPNIAIQ